MLLKNRWFEMPCNEDAWNSSYVARGVALLALLWSGKFLSIDAFINNVNTFIVPQTLLFRQDNARHRSASIHTAAYHDDSFLHPSSSSSISIITTKQIRRDVRARATPKTSSLFHSEKTTRRLFLVITAIVLPLVVSSNEAKAVRAVGSAEQACRRDKNCLEVGDWDGAIGWNWGGKFRCDASDPKCGSDGVLRDTIAQAVDSPTILEHVTTIVTMQLAIGSRSGERGVLTIGLFGDACPLAVQQFVHLLCASSSSRVALEKGGILQTIVPNSRLIFGIPSQAMAYAKAQHLSKAGDDFLPQPRPSSEIASAIQRESSPLSQDVAGLITVPKRGLGYAGNTNNNNDDEAYSNAFEITTATKSSTTNSNSKEERKAIGQLMDKESMAVLSRLTNLPIQKGFKGIVPGQNYGPPLLKVTVTFVSAVTANELNEGTRDGLINSKE